MKLFLLSSIGERHEDRIPIGIFSSFDEIDKYILKSSCVSFFESQEIESDYDDKALEIFVYYKDKDRLDEEKEYDVQYVVESFHLNNKVNLNETT